MRFPRSVSPVDAVGDLRHFIPRRPHEFGFALLALALTSIVIWMFVKDTHFEREHKREIIYVESWPLDRSLEQIRAQQKIDEPIRQARIAEIEKKRKERQESFKRIESKLEKWGL